MLILFAKMIVSFYYLLLTGLFRILLSNFHYFHDSLSQNGLEEVSILHVCTESGDLILFYLLTHSNYKIFKFRFCGLVSFILSFSDTFLI